ncbi:LacI family DNA-binding transcriptional regulator [Paenibacillus xanthanilyticus]|uniref:LacI family DNA-binding transcriptional regulator n=1 Tax=Paenibacillus xanthanilyticus TaxID=1783531 RepID=A0ABV8K7K4_9BACL
MKKVTMEQIAREVGVSKFAVSQALSGKPGVAEETRSRIVEVAERLGYRKTIKMSRKKAEIQESGEKRGSALAGTIIILMPDVRFQHRESSYWGRIIDGVLAELTARDVGVMMVTESSSERFMNSINPDGVLGLIGIGYIAGSLLGDIRALGIPAVLIDHEDEDVPTDTVFMNNYDCMRQLAKRAVKMGHADMRFVGDPAYSRSFHDRLLGFRIALEEESLPLPSADDPLLRLGDDPQGAIEAELTRMRGRKRWPSLFVCANDSHAELVIRALREQGVRVPEDVSVTGFDHTPGNADLPAISTIEVPNELMGKRAVEVLMSRLCDPSRPCEKLLINGPFIPGATLKTMQ